MIKQIKAYLLMGLMLLFITAACSAQTSESESIQPSEGTEASIESSTLTLPTQDRAGNKIDIPDNVERVISFAPSITQVIDEIGMADKLVAIDSQTPNYVQGLSDLPQFDMMIPDIEALAALNPDIMFVSGMSSAKGDNPFQQLIDLGICVVTIPSSTSIEGIKKDNQFIADILGEHEKGIQINKEMQGKIDEIAAIGVGIEEKKTVMFEIAALPTIYSFGQETFLHEMLEIIGAKNVFEDEKGWITINEEFAIAADPDVILTNVNYIDDPIEEIMAREGWENMQAIKNQDVYYIDNATSNLSNHHVVQALEEMANAVYPEYFEK